MIKMKSKSMKKSKSRSKRKIRTGLRNRTGDLPSPVLRLGLPLLPPDGRRGQSGIELRSRSSVDDVQDAWALEVAEEDVVARAAVHDVLRSVVGDGANEQVEVGLVGQ